MQNNNDENESRSTEKSHELENADLIRKILLSGSQEDLDRLSEYHKFTAEQVELFQADEKLRHDTVEQCRSDLENRIKINPVPTETELGIGAFLEQIEPQVRQAVIALRAKGYTTWESGFMGGGAQSIGFETEDLIDFKFPNELLDNLVDLGITATISNDSIDLRSEQITALNDWKKAWDLVVSEMPDLGKTAPDSKIAAAEDFRERYGK